MALKKYRLFAVIVLAVFVLALAGQALAAPKADGKPESLGQMEGLD
jgi:hypothetical protein